MSSTFRRTLSIQGLHAVLDGDYKDVHEVIQTETGPVTLSVFRNANAEFRPLPGGTCWGAYANGALLAYLVNDRWYKQLEGGATILKQGVRITYDLEEVQVPEPAAAPATQGRKMHFACDFERIEGQYAAYVTKEKEEGRPALELDPSCKSDLSVFSEVVQRRCYQAFSVRSSGAGGTWKDIFMCRPGDSVLDIGANIGASMAYFASSCGITHGTFIEPSCGRTAQKLKANLATFNRTGCAFRLVQAAIGASAGTVAFLDREECARGGSSRSTVLNVAPEARKWGAQMYNVEQLPFNRVLDKRHSVVKLDIEGSELPILERQWNWMGVRLLMVEVSVVNMRKQLGEGSWRTFAKILDNLRRAGFAYAKLEKRFWQLEYWQPDTAERSLLSDGIVWFARPQQQDLGKIHAAREEEIAPFIAWHHYSVVMKGGGVGKGTVLDAVRLAKASSAALAPSAKRQRCDDPEPGKPGKPVISE